MYTLSTNCDICNNSTIKLFAEEVQHLVKKLPFPCLHAGLISLFRLNHAGEGAVFPTPRPGFPVLPDKENKPNKTANGFRAGASSVVSAVEKGKLQQKINSLKAWMRQLMVINEKLRAAVDKSMHGMIKEYPDLEIASINEFMGEIDQNHGGRIDMAMEFMGRIAKVKEGDGLDPELDKLAKSQEAHDTRQSPEIGGKEETRSTSLPLPCSRTQEPAGMEDSASGGPKERSMFAGRRRREADRKRWRTHK